SRTFTYALFSKGTSITQLSEQLPSITEKTGDSNSQIWQPAFIPIRDIYLRHSLIGGVRSSKAIENVYIFAVIAFFVLALACFNYVSLITARSTNRAKEVGVRKVLGANRGQLFLQFLSESTLLLTFSLLLTLGVVQLLLPAFNTLIEKDLSLADLLGVKELLSLLLVFTTIIALTGSYPALVLSSFNITAILKKSLLGGMKETVFRKGLVVVQFVVSIAMIIATIVVLRQMQFVQNKDLGYEREAILNVNFQGELSADKKQVFQQSVDQLAMVESSSFCNMLPGSGMAYNKLVKKYVPEGKNPGYTHITVDANFLPTFKIDLKQGRNFAKERPKGAAQYLINQKMADYLEWGEDAVGREIGYYAYRSSPDGGYREVPITGEVIGVIQDYHQADLRTNIEPMLIRYGSGWQRQLAVKIKMANATNAVNQLKDVWTATFPNEPFAFNFLDDAFQQTYEQEVRTAKVFGIFAGLAIFISCLGLLGLVTFAAERRTKEIGIRKVLGASVATIVQLLSVDFVKMVLLALVIASPLAAYFSNQWLARFAYRIELEWWYFGFAGLFALVVTLLTVGYQSVKAALANPVESLKVE
ncbi:MAG: FtsX-like permease family protein, partial [Bacteroidota bacterium]